MQINLNIIASLKSIYSLWCHLPLHGDSIPSFCGDVELIGVLDLDLDFDPWDIRDILLDRDLDLDLDLDRDLSMDLDLERDLDRVNERDRDLL